MADLIAGMLAMGYFVAGLFFLRFWKQNGDRLFAFFAAAFWLLAVQRIGLVLIPVTGDAPALWLYGVRVIAFMTIIVAILDKNRAPRT